MFISGVICNLVEIDMETKDRIHDWHRVDLSVPTARLPPSPPLGLPLSVRGMGSEFRHRVVRLLYTQRDTAESDDGEIANEPNRRSLRSTLGRAFLRDSPNAALTLLL